MKFYNLIKLIFFSRWKMNFPPKKNILIIDGSNNPFKFLFKERAYEIIFRRGEEINLPVILKCLFSLKFSSLDYYLNYIKFVKPKIILTYYDHFDFFYKLHRLTKIKTAFVVRGKRTLSDGLFKHKKEYSKNNYVNFMFVHNQIIKKEYKKIISGKIIPIGSFLNNIKRKKQKILKKKVLWISTFKKDGKDWMNPKTNKKFKNSEFQKNDKFVIKCLNNFLKKNQLELDILGRNKNLTELIERKFYEKIIGNNFNYISKNDFPDSYKILDKYETCFTTWSTLGVEKLVKGGRVGFIFNKPKNEAWNNARLGVIEKFSLQGPFWTTCKANDQKEFERIFTFVLKAPKSKWAKVRKKFGYQLMEFDKGNRKFKNIINKVLKKNIKRFDSSQLYNKNY